MRLVEFEAKRLLREAGLPVPGNSLWNGEAIAGPAVVKAQILSGGRGKMGLIRLVEPGGLAEQVALVEQRMIERGMRPVIMVEERVGVAAEYYLAWRIDDVGQAPVLMFSPQGGVEIERNRDTIRELAVDRLRAWGPAALVPFLKEAGADRLHIGALARFATAAYHLFIAEDLELLEINPLGGTAKGTVVAMDAKISVDDNALVRHRGWFDSLSQDLESESRQSLERRAEANGLTFVELDGNIALFSSGAGLGMALLDLLADAGLRAANFVDASGGSGSNVFSAIGELVFERAAREDVDAILMFFTLTATSLKTVVESLLDTLDGMPPPKPLVIGLVAAGAAERDMTLADARAAFAERGYETVIDLDEAVEAVKRVLAEIRAPAEPAR